MSLQYQFHEAFLKLERMARKSVDNSHQGDLHKWGAECDNSIDCPGCEMLDALKELDTLRDRIAKGSDDR